MSKEKTEEAGEDTADLSKSTGRGTDQIRHHMLTSSYKNAARRTGDPTHDLPPIEDAVREYAPLVWRQARRYSRTSGGALDTDDLIQVGLMGLIQAHNSYEPEGGRAFSVFAEFRIRGAILDELRKHDPLSQPARKKQRQMEAAASRLATRLGRVPTEEQLAEEMGLSLDDLQTQRNQLQAVRFVPDDDGKIDDYRAELVSNRVPRNQLRLMLVDALTKLPERDQQVLALYYFHDLNLREIGEVMEVTEARVCQLHKAAVGRLRDLLQVEEGQGF